MMLVSGYQEAAMEFKAYSSPSLYPFFGLSEEAGEVAGKIAKAIRKSEPYNIEAITKELGDVAWMLAACCDELNLDLAHVMQQNLAKLHDRNMRGVIVGEGDER